MVISRLTDVGASLLRINLSHTSLEQLPKVISEIQSYTNVPICIDTEGAQIRTGHLTDDSYIIPDNKIVHIHNKEVDSDDANWFLNPLHIVNQFQVGDILSIDFNMVLLQIIFCDETGVKARVLTGGKVGRNKAVTLERDIPLPVLSEKDIASIQLAQKFNITHYALSFANHESDVALIRSLAPAGSFIISKIECMNGLRNFDAIASSSNAVLIDRGDLSRQISIEHIPAAQKSIIRRSKELNTEVYVATNLLESMVVSLEPTRAEVNDVYNTLQDGADGLVLAAETAIGKHPVKSAALISRLFKIHASKTNYYNTPSQFVTTPINGMPAPHGGHLTFTEKPENAESLIDSDLFTITLSEEDLMDCRQLANGTYSPLNGFMGQDDFQSVLESNRLVNGLAWTMPVILQVTSEISRQVNQDQQIKLADTNGIVRATITVQEKYEVDLVNVCQKWFGTDDQKHPGVKRVMGKGNHVIAGNVAMLSELDFPYKHLAFPPLLSRLIFAKKQWDNVVGFHTRNPPHRAHEFMHMDTLNEKGVDGVFITPVIGPKQPGDFRPEPIIDSYQALIDCGAYPRDKVVLGAFATYSRFAGPREAVFTALCRKNMGCSHFIVGRDHAGVGNYYDIDANQFLFDQFQDELGISTIFYGEIAYDADKKYYDLAANIDDPVKISGTMVRNAIKEGTTLPEWVTRKEVQSVLYTAETSSKSVFS